ncbi:hypothetical protein OsI_04832 [Oryza sativa Indica Group]|uniref:F-box associated beta-propeller type 1 domain-containing protein n=1 Tax=Oryza sativa subsp. indica TaxID=39946 RepID=A2WY29_ORYSI|nr:hypothetical protein OsI_04832 [Oryza sativa Indica Group]
MNPTSYLPASAAPWIELSTTGLGYNTATGEHKVVRLFKKRNGGEYSCEVYTQGAGGWRRCVGRVPPCAANFLPALPPVFVHGYLYWLLRPAGPGEEPIHRILSFSMGAEQFGWVYVPLRARGCLPASATSPTSTARCAPSSTTASSAASTGSSRGAARCS